MRKTVFLGLLLQVSTGALTAQAPSPIKLVVTESSLGDMEPGFEARTVLLGPDGRRFLYVVAGRSPDTSAVVLDGASLPQYSATGSPIFSPDGKRVALVARRGNKALVFVDGSEGKEYDEIAGLVFSADGRRLAYAGKQRRKESVAVDGIQGSEYDEIAGPVFSPDGRRVAYGAKRGVKEVLVVDGSEGKEYDDVYLPSFSPDGQQVAYRARRGKTELVVVDQTEGSGYEQVGQPFFSPEGKGVAYGARRDGKRLIIAGGVEGKSYDWVGDPCFSPDGKRLAYAASRGGQLISIDDRGIRFKSRGAQYFVVVDGAEGKAHDGVVLPWLRFSPDGKRLAYWALQGGVWQAQVEGAEPQESEAHGTFAFSPDGKRIAYDATRGKRSETRGFVVVEAVKGKEYDWVGPPVFSPDGRHVAYLARRGDKALLVVDGMEALAEGGFSRLYGGRVETLKASLGDWKEAVTYTANAGPLFEGSTVIHALGQKKGEGLFRLRVEIAPAAASP